MVAYQGKNVKVECNNFKTLQIGVKAKLKVPFKNQRFVYHNSEHKKWTEICDNNDFKDITDQTEVRLILKDNGKKIYVTH